MLCLFQAITHLSNSPDLKKTIPITNATAYMADLRDSQKGSDVRSSKPAPVSKQDLDREVDPYYQKRLLLAGFVGQETESSFRRVHTDEEIIKQLRGESEPERYKL